MFGNTLNSYNIVIRVMIIVRSSSSPRMPLPIHCTFIYCKLHCAQCEWEMVCVCVHYRNFFLHSPFQRDIALFHTMREFPQCSLLDTNKTWITYLSVFMFFVHWGKQKQTKNKFPMSISFLLHIFMHSFEAIAMERFIHIVCVTIACGLANQTETGRKIIAFSILHWHANDFWSYERKANRLRSIHLKAILWADLFPLSVFYMPIESICDLHSISLWKFDSAHKMYAYLLRSSVTLLIVIKRYSMYWSSELIIRHYKVRKSADENHKFRFECNSKLNINHSHCWTCFSQQCGIQWGIDCYAYIEQWAWCMHCMEIRIRYDMINGTLI